MAKSYWSSSHYLEWLLDRQDVMIHRVGDLKIFGSEEEYQKVMIFFTNVIQAFGKSVEVRQQVVATAIVYFKRFYSRNSFKTIDPWLMAPSCIFLASKVEEFGVVSQKNLMTSCRNVVHNNYVAYFPDGYGYPYRAQDVLECEFILLEAMDCSLIVFHPYRPLTQFLDELRSQLFECADLLLERAWWLVNDSFRTDVCLHYPPYIIALSCLQLATLIIANRPDLSNNPTTCSSSNLINSKHTHHQAQSNISPIDVVYKWFSELNVNMEKVLEVSRHLLSLYDLLRRFDEAEEMPNLLLKKLPKPMVQTIHSTQNYPGTTNTVNATTCPTTVSQSSANLSGGGHTSLIVANNSGGIATTMPDHLHPQQLPSQQQQHQMQQQQRAMNPTNQGRIHPQAMPPHMGVR